MESKLMNLSMAEESNTSLIQEHEQNENEKSVDDVEIRPWAELPTELLQLIFRNLFQSDHILYLDHIRFRLTCKAWHSIGQFPLLMFSPQTGTYNFFNPITNKEVLDRDMDIPELIDPDMDIPELIDPDMDIPELIDPITNEEVIDGDMDIPKLVHIHCSRFGWLLMSRAKHLLFFYNPFIPGSTIELPELTTRYTRFVSMSFTAPPTSSDCIVYAHDEPKPGSVVVIHKWCYGEDDWTDYHVDCQTSFEPSSSSPIFYRGVFYQLDVYGRLGVSDHKKCNDWKDLPLPKILVRMVEQPKLPLEDIFSPHYTPMSMGDIFSSHCMKNYMAECDGKLVVVFVGYSPCKGKPIRVFELDWSRMVWVTVRSLGNKAMFICDTGSLLIKTDGRRGTENKIYLPMFANMVEDGGRATKKVGVFYCLKSRKYNISPEYWTERVKNCTWIDTKFQP